MDTTAGRWYRSLYWRIGISFVLLVVAVILAQGVMFSYRLERSNLADTEHSPNNVATIVAADLGGALASDPALDLQAFLRERFEHERWTIFLVMKDGQTAGNRTAVLPDGIQRSAAAALSGVAFRQPGDQPRISGPVVTAPVQVSGELRGIVLLPPPPAGGLGREVWRLFSLPGTALLILGTALAAIVIFGPARLRLKALEQAAASLGRGNLAARAPESGGDEIARVALAFNRMAADLAARDEALRTSDRLRRQMFADVSHELKTPLTAMRGYLETLRMPEVALDGETRERYLDTVERETRRLERIVADLLDLARYENTESPLEARLFAIERLFDHVAKRHEREAQARDITIATQVDEEADQLVGEPDRIEQVIENLVANALHHTPAGGTVELRAMVRGDAAVLQVVDSGAGIAPDHLPHVFDRFYKVDASRAAGSGGSGLGLSIARAIVERHGGTIHVSSVPGRTEFAVVLPQGFPDPSAPGYSAPKNL